MKERILNLLRSYGFEVRHARKNPNLTDFLVDRRITLALDIGANVGQFGDALRGEGYRGKIVLFQPISSVFRQLALRAMAR